MRSMLLALALLIAVPAVCAQVFRWVDDQGNVHFSDRADGADAEEVDLPPASIYEPRQVELNADKGADTAGGDAAQQAIAEPYRKVAIVKPEDDGTVRDNQGLVDLVVELDPALQEGHRLAVELDGRTLFDQLTTNSVTLSNLDRGSHNLMVRVLDADGAEQAAAEPVTFHLHRATVLRPAPITPTPRGG